MDDQIMRLAALHYVQEQNVRHLRIWENREQAAPPPDFNVMWNSIPPIVRDQYIKRAELFTTSDSHVETQEGYGSYLFKLYTNIYPGVSQAEAETSPCIDIEWFKRYSKKGTQEGRPQRVQDLSDGENYYDDSDVSSDKEDDTTPEAPVDYDMLDQEDPALLEMEKSVKEGDTALRDLRDYLIDEKAETGNIEWQKEIPDILRLATPGKVRIGVVGSTGVGKSSIINAILDEENLLPTNCIQAATAVATQILYCDEEANYKAEISFIKRCQWEKELKMILGDISDDQDDVLAGRVTKDSETAIALAKIQAVYPSLKTKDLLNTPVENLLNNDKVSNLFGKALMIKASDAKSFSDQLKYYVDSKARRRGKAVDEPISLDGGMRLWPLIRDLKIFTKAKALSTGAVLVDLPGVGDSNRARSAVADEFVKTCSAHWIVAPINRAVNDRVAHDLLGENFKRQLQMDLAFNDITFICSKTDDINVDEVQDALELTLPSMQEQKQGEIRQKQLQNQIKKLNVDQKENGTDLRKIDRQIEEIDVRLSPTLAQSLTGPPSKKQKRDTAIDPTGQPPSNLPSPQEIRSLWAKRIDLQGERKRLEDQRQSADVAIQQKQREVSLIKKESKYLQDKIIGECIVARNEFSKTEVRRDFVMAVRDLDRVPEEDMEDDEEEKAEYRPLHDYNKLETELPVFCVSAKAYQKLRGRVRNEHNVVNFENIDRTEIPQLQRHCLSLTGKARWQSARRFLLRLDQLLHSLRLWSLARNPAEILTEQKKAEIESDFDNVIESFKQDMENSMNETLANLQKTFESGIYKNLEQASILGSQEFVRSVARWNSRPKDGGFHHCTYGAFCRHLGVFKGQDLNQDLANPMLAEVVQHWAGIFGSQLPLRLDQLTKSFVECLYRFHRKALLSADQDIRECNRKALSEALKTRSKDMEQLVRQIETQVRTEQRNVNRIFVETITKELEPTYDECAAIKGPGKLKRMRNRMAHEAEHNGSAIFQFTARQAQEGLEKLLDMVQRAITGLIESTVDRLRRDYYTAIIEAKIKKYSERQLILKNAMVIKIRKVEEDLQLKRYVNAETIQELRTTSGTARGDLEGMKGESEEDLEL